MEKGERGLSSTLDWKKGRVADNHDFRALYIPSFDTYLNILTHIIQHIHIHTPPRLATGNRACMPPFRCTARSTWPPRDRPPARQTHHRENPDGPKNRPTAERKRLGAGLGPGLAVPTGHYHAIHSDVILALTHPSPATRAPVFPFAKRRSVEWCWPFGVGNVGTRNMEFLSLSPFFVPGLNGEDLAVRDDRANCGESDQGMRACGENSRWAGKFPRREGPR